MNKKAAKEYIENNIDVQEFWNTYIASKYNVQAFYSKRGIVCPFHSDVNPSFKVYDKGNVLHCFGCGTTLGVVSALVRVSRLPGNVPLTEEEAITVICELYKICIEKEIEDYEDNFFTRHKKGKTEIPHTKLESIIKRREKIDMSETLTDFEKIQAYADLDLAVSTIFSNVHNGDKVKV